MKRLIAIGERGGRVGEDNGRAKLTDGEVELIRALHADHGLTYPTLADKFDVSVFAHRENLQVPAQGRSPDRLACTHLLSNALQRNQEARLWP